jgi:hypothetical protein
VAGQAISTYSLAKLGAAFQPKLQREAAGVPEVDGHRLRLLRLIGTGATGGRCGLLFVHVGGAVRMVGVCFSSVRDTVHFLKSGGLELRSVVVVVRK